MALISPSGRYVAARIIDGGQHGFVIYDLNQPDAQPFAGSLDSWKLANLYWASDERLLLSAVQWARYSESLIWSLPQTRLLAINADGSNPQYLGASWDPYASVVGIVVDILPDDPEHILVAHAGQHTARLAVSRLNIDDGTHRQIQGPRRGVQWWAADQQGRLRLGAGIRLPGNQLEIIHRAADGNRWQVLYSQAVDSDRRFRPLRFYADDPDLVLVLSNHEGPAGLYRFRISTRSFEECLHCDPDLDITEVLFDASGRQVVAFQLADEAHRTWLQAEFLADAMQSVQNLLPDRFINLQSVDTSRNRMVLQAEGPDLPPRLYVYAPADQRLVYLAPVYPLLEGRVLGPTRLISFTTRDGTERDAWLTLPPSASHDTPGPRPLVVIPHGLPLSPLYFTRFQPAVQMMVSRGYMVLQLSPDEALPFAEDGMPMVREELPAERNWQLMMQDDVSLAARSLIAAGMADPDRICLLSGSFGSYAALMAPINDPELYACTVSIDSLSDPGALPTAGRADSAARRIIRRLTRGEDEHPGWMERFSPAQRAAEIQTPVLLLESRTLGPVWREQHQRMLAALQEAGVEHETFDPDTIAISERSARGEETNFALLAIDGFLGRHLGGASE